MAELYLYFNGNCREATGFYAQAFGTAVQNVMTYGGAPDAQEMSPEAAARILYSDMIIGGSTLMFSDCPEDMPYQQGNNFSVTVDCEDEAVLTARFDRLAAGGRVDMPVGPTFFARCFAMVTDKFGVQWQLVCASEKPEKEE